MNWFNNFNLNFIHQKRIQILLTKALAQKKSRTVTLIQMTV